ncbi:MAG TPA: DUF2156 domain-containing protein [Methanoculleus sp.]|nr:DUF2156 domain-containing protein [Methanoculleus sp.]
MLSLSDFQPVTLTVRDRIQDHFQKFLQVHSEKNSTTLIAWKSFSDYSYAFIEDNLVISAEIQGMRLFHAPVGPRKPAILAAVLQLARGTGGERPFYIFDRASRDWFVHEYPEIPLRAERDFFDYIYLTDDLADLPGKRYVRIRRHINKFNKNCNYHIERIGPENMQKVREFLDKWCEWKHCEESEVLAHEKNAILFCIDHFTELGLDGLLVIVDGGISALSIFDRLNDDMVLVHFEKGLPDCEGNYKVINMETARYLRENYRNTFINRESDVGIPGLREAKLRYYPHHFAEVWSVAGRDIPADL